jgi:hypothetical protein
MPNVYPFTGLYAQAAFIKQMNAQYYPAAAMQASVQKIIALKGIAFLKTIKYGDYQTILVPLDTWLPALAKVWPQAMKEARDGLAPQVNLLSLPGPQQLVPASKLALLDAVVNYCFNTALPGQQAPGIPMVIDVQQKASLDPGNDLHDIHVSWTRDPASGAPIQLNWTMVCPAAPPPGASKTKASKKKKKKDKSKKKKAKKKKRKK